MPRPSQDQDRALLQAGAELYPELGCAGLSVRRLAQSAGVNPAMVHYHFGSKEGFLRELLQQTYEGLFNDLTLAGDGETDPLARLGAALFTLARFVREHRALIGRVWADAREGHAVAIDFMRANAPRHMQLVMRLIAEAERQGRLPASPMLTRATFLMGSVLAPIVVVSGVQNLGVLPPPFALLIEDQVFSDAALQRRIEWALLALSTGV